MTAADPRAALIADLRAFADLLERRPDLPIDRWTTVSVHHSVPGADDVARLAEAERIAALLGVDLDRGATSATARLMAGRVEYTAHASTDRGRAEWQATISYLGAIEPAAVSS